MTEVLAVIDAPHFYAAIVLIDDKVTRAAPIVKYMRGWPRDRVRDYCKRKGWHIFVAASVETPENSPKRPLDV